VGQSLVETIGLTEQEYSTYVELSLSSLSVMVHCRKCTFCLPASVSLILNTHQHVGERAAFVVRADLESEDIISCPLPDCSYKWCKNCNLAIEGEESHSCDGTDELKKLMAEEGWKVCLLTNDPS
jgi:hypothetical protein